MVTKAPIFRRLSPIKELELTVNFLDPFPSHIFHRPDSNKLFICLNRKDDNTLECRPDATIVVSPKRAENVTLCYVEVKPLDVQSNLELAFTDLVSLGVFARLLMLKKSN